MKMNEPLGTPHVEMDALFQKVYEGITKVLPFVDAWAESNNLFLGAVVGPEAIKCTAYADMVSTYCLMVGDMAKFEDSIGRRGIVVGTRFGPVLIFNKRTPEYYARYGYSCTETFKRAGYVNRSSDSPTLLEMKLVLGCHTDPDAAVVENIGHVLDRVYWGMLRVAADPMFGGARKAPAVFHGTLG